jgi:CheY-like chemotaxis protein
MHVLIVSSSGFRRSIYQQVIEALGHEVALADGGVDCLQRMRHKHPDLLLLEAPLLWGGSDGVLELLESSGGQPRPRVIVVAVGPGSIDWFQLSRFRVDDLLFRIPTVPELQRAIGSVPAGPPSHHLPAPYQPDRPYPVTGPHVPAQAPAAAPRD